MKTLILTLSLIVGATSFAGPGGGDHSHSHGTKELSREKIEKLGRSHVERLVKSGKIDQSWKSSIFEKSEKKTFAGEVKWVVTFKNEKGVKGKILFIFLSKKTGAFVAANFTGK